MSRALRCVAVVGMSALLLTGCGAEPEDSSEPLPESTNPALHSLREDASSTELIDQLQAVQVSFTDDVDGDWRHHDGTPVTGRRDHRQYRAGACEYDKGGKPTTDAKHFDEKVIDASLEQPDRAFTQARQWADRHGWRQDDPDDGYSTESKRGFVTFSGEGKATITLHVLETGKAMLTVTSPCSEDSTVQGHNLDRTPELTVPGNRFKKTETPTPSPSSTKLGVSG